MSMVPQIPLPKGDRWMRTREVATLFGVDGETVNRWRREGKIKGYPVTRMFWFKRSDINKLLAAKELPTI